MNYSLSRRTFIRTTAALAMSQLLQSCSNSEAVFKILFLKNSIPLQLIGDFRKAINSKAKIDFQPQTQLAQIFDSLFTWQSDRKLSKENKKLLDKIVNKSAVYPSLTTLGDFWLSSAIEQNLIQPLSVKDLANWQQLPTPWQQIVKRDRQGNLSSNGKIFGAPYRWGSTVIAYQSKKLQDLNITVEDWQDLWQPELKDRISLLDSPRETIGLTLKKLGQSYNTDDLESVPNLEKELLALHKQARLYSSERYLEPLIVGDTLAAVAWSNDVFPLLKRYPDLQVVIPPSGTALWADIWVKPQVSVTINDDSSNNIIEEWIDFCWQAKAAKQISLFTNGISPILSSLNSAELPQDLKNNPLLNSAILQSKQSEFLLPLTPKTEKQYRDLWLKIRQR